MNKVLIKAPEAAPRIGSVCNAAFSDTTMPKRELIKDTSFTNAGAPALLKPFSARYLVASLTAPAMAIRAAK